jgi:DNA modification methylase
MSCLTVECAGGRYYLKERSNSGEYIETIARYGEEKPAFRQAEVKLGFCEDRLSNLQGQSIDLIIDDPPYGITQEEWDTEPNWSELTDEFHRVLADDGLVVIFGRQPSLIPVYNTFTDNGFDFRFEMIWKKENNPWVSNHQTIPIHENIFVFKKSDTLASDTTFRTDSIRRRGVDVCDECGAEEVLGAWSTTTTNDQKPSTQGGWQEVHKQSGDESRFPTSYIDRDVLKFSAVQGGHDEYTGYPAQKPTDLLMWLIKAMTMRGDKVLDPHAGSGSTAAACIPLCRDSVNYEVNPSRYKTAKERVNDKVDRFRGLKHADVIDEPDLDQTSKKTPADD